MQRPWADFRESTVYVKFIMSLFHITQCPGHMMERGPELLLFSTASGKHRLSHYQQSLPRQDGGDCDTKQTDESVNARVLAAKSSMARQR